MLFLFYTADRASRASAGPELPQLGLERSVTESRGPRKSEQRKQVSV